MKIILVLDSKQEIVISHDPIHENADAIKLRTIQEINKFWKDRNKEKQSAILFEVFKSSKLLVIKKGWLEYPSRIIQDTVEIMKTHADDLEYYKDEFHGRYHIETKYFD